MNQYNTIIDSTPDNITAMISTTTSPNASGPFAGAGDDKSYSLNKSSGSSVALISQAPVPSSEHSSAASGPNGPSDWVAQPHFPVNDPSSTSSSSKSFQEAPAPNPTPVEVFRVIPNVTQETQTIHTPTGTIKIKEMLGKGSFGQVYRAQDTEVSEHPRQYAVKVMPRGDPNTPVAPSKIVEAVCHRVTSDHPNVVTLHHALQDEKFVYLVMDLVKGGSLGDRLDEVYDGEVDMLGLNEDLGVKKVFTQILDAVSHCHERGICHRDLKPDNILVSNDGDVFLTDFGLSSAKEYSNSTVGSRPYMSPGKPFRMLSRALNIHSILIHFVLL